MKRIEIEGLKGKELVNFYNELVETHSQNLLPGELALTKIKKFSDKATGVARTKALYDKVNSRVSDEPVIVEEAEPATVYDIPADPKEILYRNFGDWEPAAGRVKIEKPIPNGDCPAWSSKPVQRINLNRKPKGVFLDFVGVDDVENVLITFYLDQDGDKVTALRFNKQTGGFTMAKVTGNQLRNAAKELNAAGILFAEEEGEKKPYKVNPICSNEELVERFLKAVEGIPKDDEGKIPAKVIETYNNLTGEGDDFGLAPTPQKNDGKKGSGKSGRPASSYTRIQAAIDAAKNLDGEATKDQVITAADALYVEKGGNSNLRESAWAVNTVVVPLARIEGLLPHKISGISEGYGRIDALLDALDAKGGIKKGEIEGKVMEILEKKGKSLSAKETSRQISIALPAFIATGMVEEDGEKLKLK
jgi:hypothetical protein